MTHNSKEERMPDWIYSVLVGKKEEEIFCRDSFVRFEINRTLQCIKTVKLEDEITQEYAERVLKGNCYFGERAYRYIRQNYNKKNKVTIYFKKNERPKIKISYETPGVIIIFLPTDLN